MFMIADLCDEIPSATLLVLASILWCRILGQVVTLSIFFPSIDALVLASRRRYYSTGIFSTIGVSQYVSTAIVGIINFLTTFGTLVLVDRVSLSLLSRSCVFTVYPLQCRACRTCYFRVPLCPLPFISLLSEFKYHPWATSLPCIPLLMNWGETCTCGLFSFLACVSCFSCTCSCCCFLVEW